MSIRRQRRPEKYTNINNDIFKDNHLSFQAVGLLCYLLSKPHNWQVSVSHLVKVTEGTAKKTGRDGVYSILRELVAAGYILREKHSSGEIDYIVLDEPHTDNPEQVNPNTDKPDLDNPDLANTTQINTEDIVNTEREQKPIIPLEHTKLTSIPEGLNIEAWQSWLNYKKEIKALYKTERGELAKAKELIRLAGGDQAYQAFLVNHSIDNEWRGIYPPGNKGRPQYKSTADHNEAAIAEWLAGNAAARGRTFEHGE